MFKPTQNIDIAFRAMRVMMIVVVMGSLLVSGYAIYTNYILSVSAQDKVYVLHNGRAVEVFASTRREHIGVEARDHVARFHELFFSLDPDEQAINATMKRALYLADESAKRQYDDLVETGYIGGVISGNISQQIFIDSVQLTEVSEPYSFRCFATLKILRSTSIVTRNLITSGRLRTVARTTHNPHGFIIEKWETIENKDLKIEER